jgi:hypothetical protein
MSSAATETEARERASREAAWLSGRDDAVARG